MVLRHLSERRSAALLKIEHLSSRLVLDQEFQASRLDSIARSISF